MARYYTGQKRGRPSKALMHILTEAGIKQEVKKVVKEAIRRGRKASPTESLRVLDGRLKVKRAKSREIIVGNKVYEA